MFAQHSVIQLEWDRGHEELTAFLHYQSGGGFTVSPIFDYSPSRGYKWIRESEVTEVIGLGPDAPEVRYIATGAPDVPPSPDPKDLLGILNDLKSDLVAVFTSEYGSSETAVGTALAVADSALTLELIGPDGLWLGERAEIRLEDIISIEWMTDYLGALSLIARSE